MVTTTIVNNDIVWSNPSGVLAILKNYSTYDHDLEIKEDDAFDIECTLANMDDTYEQTTWSKFFPPSVDHSSNVYNRIRSIIQGNYVNGKQEREWVRKDLEELESFLKKARKKRLGK